MSPVKLHAVVWQIVASHPVAGLTLSLELHTAVRGFAETGERLDALTVTTPGLILSMGGPDSEGVLRRAPGRWTEAEVEVDIAEPATLRWHLPSLRPDESVQLAAAVAWSPSDDDGTWFAVDVELDKVLGDLLG